MKRFLSSRYALKKKKGIYLKYSVVLALFIILIILSIWIINRESLCVKKVKIEGTIYSDPQKISSLVEEELSGKKIFFLNSCSLPIISRKKIEKKVLDSFFSIKNVKIDSLKNKPEIGYTININVEEKSPELLWCGEEYSENTEIDCHYVDDQGFIFSKAVLFSGASFTPFYGPTDDKKISISAEPIKINKFLTNLKSLSFLVDRFEYFLDGESAIYISRNENSEFKIYIDDRTDLDSAFNRLKLVYENNQNMFSNIQYIDLRFGNDVIVK